MPAKLHRIGTQGRPLRLRFRQVFGKQQYAQHSQRCVPEKRGDRPWQSAGYDVDRVRKAHIQQPAQGTIFLHLAGPWKGYRICRLSASSSRSAKELQISKAPKKL